MIEYALKSDLFDILRLETENMPMPYSKSIVESLFDNPRVKILKAVVEGKVVAYVSAELTFDEASINNVVVDGGYRRRGIGDKLILFLKEDLKESGIRKIFLEVATKNVGAINLYTKNGFFEISRRKGYYGDDDAIIMQADL